MQPHLPTPFASPSSFSFSLSFSLFPSASAVAYLPLRRSRLSLTKPRRDAAERGRALQGISAALLRSICDHFHITFTPPPPLCLLFPLPAPTVGARLPPYVAFVCVCVYFCTHHAAPARGLCVRLPFGFSIFRLPLRVLSLFFYLPQALRLMACRA